MTTIVFFTARAIKLDTLLQIVLSLITFIISTIIFNQWTHNPLVATIMFVLIGIVVNFGLILGIRNWLPTVVNSFRTKPAKSYFLLALAIILLVIYMLFLAFVGLHENSLSYPIVIMLITGGFTFIVGLTMLGLRLSINTKD